MRRNLLALVKPIRSRREYERALAVVEEHFDAKLGTHEANIVEVLALLVERYEEEHFPIEAPHPVEAILFRMEQLGWTQQDLARVLGSKSRASEILNRKRDLSLSMIRDLHSKLGVPAESLIRATA